MRVGINAGNERRGDLVGSGPRWYSPHASAMARLRQAGSNRVSAHALMRSAESMARWASSEE